MTCVHLFTNGRCRGHPGLGGWAFLLRDVDAQGRGHERVESGAVPHTPNNRMELESDTASVVDLSRYISFAREEETMFATATLVAHRGAQLVSREALATYEPPAATKSWKPVKHVLIVDLMHEELDRRNIRITKEEYAIQREGNSLFAALTLNWLRDEEMSAAIAFRHANDKSEAMKMYAGVHVFICDNMALSGDEIILNRRHTTRLNVATELTKAFDRYHDGALVLQRHIGDLKRGPLSLGDAQRQLFEIFYRQMLPARMLVPVTDSYLAKEDRTAWGLLNALTLHAKNLPPHGNIRAHVRLGRYFGLGKADPYVCSREDGRAAVQARDGGAVPAVAYR